MESAPIKFGDGKRAGHGFLHRFERGHTLVNRAAAPLQDIAHHEHPVCEGREAVIAQEGIEAGLVGAHADVGAVDVGRFVDSLQGEAQQKAGIVRAGIVCIGPEADPGAASAPQDLDTAGEPAAAVIVQHIAGNVDVVRVGEDGRDAVLVRLIGGKPHLQPLHGHGGDTLIEPLEFGCVGGTLRPQGRIGRGERGTVEPPDGDLGEGHKAGLSEGIDEERLVGQVAEEPADVLAEDMLGAGGEQFLPDGGMALGGVEGRGKQGDVGFVGVGADAQLDESFAGEAVLVLAQHVGEGAVTVPGKAGTECGSHRRNRFQQDAINLERGRIVAQTLQKQGIA